jgi:sugar phosphate permease
MVFKKKFGKSFGIDVFYKFFFKFNIVSIGEVLGRVILGELMHINGFTWRFSFIFVGILIFLILLMILYPLKEKPEDVELSLQETIKTIEINENFETKMFKNDDDTKENSNLITLNENKNIKLDNVNINEINNKTTFQAVIYIITSPRVWLMMITMSALNCFFNFNEEYVPLYLHVVFDLSEGQSAQLSSFCPAGSVLG